jgi:hypothetical protein
MGQKAQQLRAIADALRSTPGLDPKTQKSVQKVEQDFPEPFWSGGKIEGIKRNDVMIHPGVPDDSVTLGVGLEPMGGVGQAVAKIPPALARALGKQLVSGMPRGKVRDVFSALQKKYPRLMGHVSSVTAERPDELSRGMAFNKIAQNDWEHGVTRAQAMGRQPAHIESAGLMDEGAEVIHDNSLPFFHPEAAHLTEIKIDPALRLTQMANTAAHELAHTAQRVRRGRTFGHDYTQESNLIGYRNNKFEKTARQAGENFQTKFAAEKGEPIIREGWKIISSIGPNGKVTYKAEKVLKSGKTRKK